MDGAEADGDGADQRGESIGGLVGRLIEDGRDYAGAELALLKAIAEYRARRARTALVALAAGCFLMMTSTTALVMGAVLSLGDRIGPMWGGLAIGVPLLLGGYLLLRFGLAGMKGLGQDRNERDAIERGARP